MRKHGDEHRCHSCNKNVPCDVLYLTDDDGVDAEYWLCDSCMEYYLSDSIP